MKSVVETTKGIIGLSEKNAEAWDESKQDKRWPGSRKSQQYIIYLIAVALFGWSLASFDFSIYVLTIADIAKAFHFSPTQVGLVAWD